MSDSKNIADNPTPLGRRLVQACGGSLHDGKAERIAGYVARAGDQQAFAKYLGATCPGLTDEQKQAILAIASQERGWSG